MGMDLDLQAPKSAEGDQLRDGDRERRFVKFIKKWSTRGASTSKQLSTKIRKKKLNMRVQ